MVIWTKGLLKIGYVEMVVNQNLYTIEEYQDYADAHPDKLLELIDGRIVEKMTSEEHGLIVLKIGAALLGWKKANNIQRHASTESCHRLEDNQHNECRPDVSFRITTEEVSSDTALYTMPDFAVEVKSRNNRYDELRDKAKFYIEYGTALVWLVYPEKSIVEVYYADGTSELFTEDNTLDGGTTLPDFSMTVAEIFE